MSAAVLTILLSAVLAEPDAVPEVRTLRGHKGWVGALAFKRDGKQLITGSADRTVGFWDAETGKGDRSPLHKHDDSITDLAVVENGFVTASLDGTATLWGLGFLNLRGHRGAVLSVCYSPSEKLLASGGIDGTVRLWDLYGHKVANLRGHRSWVNCVRFSADGKRLASASSDATVRQWRQEKGEWKTKSIKEVPEGEVRCVAFSPDGKLVALGTGYGTVRVWDLAKNSEPAVLKGHTGDVWALAFSPDGKTLASGGGDWDRPGEVRLWDTSSWKRRATLKHTGEVLCVAYSPNGRLLAAGGWDGVVKLWDVSRLRAKED
jgi:WD40 repeat protein